MLRVALILFGLVMILTAQIDALGMAPPGMQFVGLLFVVAGGYLIYKKYFAKF